MDELTKARLSRDIDKLRDEHQAIGLADPLLSLTEVADRYGIDVDTAIKLWMSDGQPNQIQPSVH